MSVASEKGTVTRRNNEVSDIIAAAVAARRHARHDVRILQYVGRRKKAGHRHLVQVVDGAVFTYLCSRGGEPDLAATALELRRGNGTIRRPDCTWCAYRLREGI